MVIKRTWNDTPKPTQSESMMQVRWFLHAFWSHYYERPAFWLWAGIETLKVIFCAWVRKRIFIYYERPAPNASAHELGLATIVTYMTSICTHLFWIPCASVHSLTLLVWWLSGKPTSKWQVACALQHKDTPTPWEPRFPGFNWITNKSSKYYKNDTWQKYK